MGTEWQGFFSAELQPGMRRKVVKDEFHWEMLSYVHIIFFT